MIQRLLAAAWMLLMATAASRATPPEGSPVIFFDWDSAVPVATAKPVIEQLGQAYQTQKFKMHVTGYTDRSGSAAYNQKLSERRARNVANMLARLGVPRRDMIVSGRGENDNRVPTAPGVADPQNRRVEIY